jgi:hypothetical protein
MFSMICLFSVGILVVLHAVLDFSLFQLFYLLQGKKSFLVWVCMIEFWRSFGHSGLIGIRQSWFWWILWYCLPGDADAEIFFLFTELGFPESFD